MGRLILILLAVVACVAVFATVSSATQQVAQRTKEAFVPKTVQTVSYVLLIVLMFGVVTGWLGGL